MTDLELDEVLTIYWPRVVRQTMADGADDWLKGFVRSIARQGKRRNWRPTPKQAFIMRQLVNDVRQASGADDPVIERD